MKNLLPIRIKITRGMVKGQVQNIYPDFNSLPADLRGSMDWSSFVDLHGLKMHYDGLSGFGEVDSYNNDPTVMYCATLVPEDFASEAQKRFPDQVVILTEADFEKFYNERAHANEPEHIHDNEVLQTLLIKEQLRDRGLLPAATDEEKEITRKTLDPAHPSMGIRRNPNRTYEDVKKRLNFQIRSTHRKPS